ncbi:MAG: hypothetical protein KF764_22355 [Labilithrix sp.]|nr:hypothetical protein [Labilithrix sp.]MBX3224922.1 hypothetical protein [Labilithrix sp.]
MSRRLLAVTMFAAPLVIVGVACSFPEVTFGSGDGAEGGAEAAPDDAQGDAATDDVSFVADAVAREDGRGAIMDASVCEARPKCDCDDDGFAAVDCDVDAAGLTSSKGAPLKLGDCDDLDPLRFPGQDYVSEVPEPGKDGDWNCNDVVERFPPAKVTCAGNGLGGCRGNPGFLIEPVCGTAEDVYACEAQGIGACRSIPKGKATQLCK